MLRGRDSLLMTLISHSGLIPLLSARLKRPKCTYSESVNLTEFVVWKGAFGWHECSGAGGLCQGAFARSDSVQCEKHVTEKHVQLF